MSAHKLLFRARLDRQSHNFIEFLRLGTTLVVSSIDETSIP